MTLSSSRSWVSQAVRLQPWRCKCTTNWSMRCALPKFPSDTKAGLFMIALRAGAGG